MERPPLQQSSRHQVLLEAVLAQDLHRPGEARFQHLLDLQVNPVRGLLAAVLLMRPSWPGLRIPPYSWARRMRPTMVFLERTVVQWDPLFNLHRITTRFRRRFCALHNRRRI